MFTLTVASLSEPNASELAGKNCLYVWYVLVLVLNRLFSKLPHVAMGALIGDDILCALLITGQ